ncbi:MAG TPA: AAA family ATPase [Chloroflexia bacterium]|nr:AAA family ATPase [Chloroflexia bacterium]
MSSATTEENTGQQEAEAEAPEPEQRRAWWLATRRRRSEWQALSATGAATFAGRPRAHYAAARPGDPVLLYVSRPDHAIRAVGVVSASLPGDVAAEGEGGDGRCIEVQMAFELPSPLGWRDIAAQEGLAGAEPVRQRSSGTLFALTPEEYAALRGMIEARNPELAAAFDALDSTETAPTGGKEAVEAREVERPRTVRERPAEYAAGDGGSAPSYGVPPVRSIAELQALTGLRAETLEEARDLLEDTGQIILSGPPGTGKTWLARGLASLAAGDPARVQVVQFHPSTAYEDFIEGLKPRLDATGNVTYAVMPGTFVRLCEAARRDPDHHYVLLVDEINRAPLSRVFGELLYALEYRGPQGAVELAVSGGMGTAPRPFYVPENVLVIGTMNSADRSIAMVDYALRRRFRFVELEPDAGILDRWLAAHGASAKARQVVLDLFGAVNRRLAESLDPDHRLGHSYFMLDPLTGAALDRLWRTAIRPLIAEYFVPPSGEVEEYAELFAEAADALPATE